MLKRISWLLLLAGCATAPGSRVPGVSVVDVHTSACIPVQTPLELTIRLRVEGDVAPEIELVILGGPEEVRERVRISGPGDPTFQIRLKALPAGEYRLRVAVADSSAAVFVRVRPGRTRVLFVEGMPRYEYRFLKNALIKDPSFDVHCYLTSADPGFVQEHSVESDDPKFMAPLAKLPATIDDLLRYDVVILGDVGPAAVPPDLLKKFVTEHGRGVVIISGEQNQPKKWKGTDFEAVMPVEMDAAPARVTAESGYRLTDEGRGSPLVALAADPPRVMELWEDPYQLGKGLPGIRWAVVTRRRPDAQTLVETREKHIPIFVTREAGHGRVFFSSTDETWMWRYLVGDHPYFFPFWRRVIEWANRVE